MKTEIIIHHSAGDDATGLNWGHIRAYHVSPPPAGPADGPYRDIAYNFGIEQVDSHYEMLIGRALDDQGAHCPGHNTSGIGVCFVGNFELYPMPKEQLTTGAKGVAMLMRIFNIPKNKIYKHSQFKDTACPGKFFPWDEFMELLF